MYRNSKWAEKIINLQQEDGSWRHFHLLSKPTLANPMTTKQALRRLLQLGFTAKDEPIVKALIYLKKLLANEINIPDRREKALNWDCFEKIMFASWVKILEPDNKDALKTAEFLADMISASFAEGIFNKTIFSAEYRNYIPKLHHTERLISLSQFYMVNLLKGVLSPKIESAYFSYILNYPTGIGYIYSRPVAVLPLDFASIDTSRYLAAIENLAGYTCTKKELDFAVEWIDLNRDKGGFWDLGSSAKDDIYLPLSNSWRNIETRKKDCTYRIQRILDLLENS